jgi:CXXX repeat modification system protein
MENKVIWQLTDEELKEIEDLFEKKNAYENLVKIVDVDNEKIYQKLISEYTKTINEFNNWWKHYSKKYNWEGKNWFIDFQNKQVLSSMGDIK